MSSDHDTTDQAGPQPGATSPRKRVALVAHDNRKRDMVEWVAWNYRILVRHHLVCTGTTGRLVDEVLRERLAGDGADAVEVEMTRLKSGPLGGDQQLGALIAEGGIDLAVFFWDPLEPHPHDVDVKALLRIAVVYNVPIACNRATADYIISSPLMDGEYQPQQKDFTAYVERPLPTTTVPPADPQP